MKMVLVRIDNIDYECRYNVSIDTNEIHIINRNYFSKNNSLEDAILQLIYDNVEVDYNDSVDDLVITDFSYEII